jgi:hypothetical protein
MRHKPSELIDIRCKIQSAVMFSNAKKRGLRRRWTEIGLGMLPRLKFKKLSFTGFRVPFIIPFTSGRSTSTGYPFADAVSTRKTDGYGKDTEYQTFHAVIPTWQRSSDKHHTASASKRPAEKRRRSPATQATSIPFRAAIPVDHQMIEGRCAVELWRRIVIVRRCLIPCRDHVRCVVSLRAGHDLVDVRLDGGGMSWMHAHRARPALSPVARRRGSLDRDKFISFPDAKPEHICRCRGFKPNEVGSRSWGNVPCHPRSNTNRGSSWTARTECQSKAEPKKRERVRPGRALAVRALALNSKRRVHPLTFIDDHGSDHHHSSSSRGGLGGDATTAVA